MNRRVWYFGLGILCLASGALAQSGAPSQEQIELLQSLPEDQREALLEDFAGDRGSARRERAPAFPDLIRPPEEAVDDDLDETLRVRGGDTLIVTFELPDNEDDELLAPSVRSLIGTRALQTSMAGELVLPGVATVPLIGLSEEEVEIRLSAVESFRDVTISARLLPLEPIGVAALDYFGYDLFEGVPTTFAPATDIPVPTDYVLGPGDELLVEYLGNENRSITTAVTRDGEITLPEIGPIQVAGLSFSNVRADIVDRVAERMIGVRASVSLGELRSIRIFVLGDVNRPGSFTVSGLSTMTNALFLSGGIQTTGSLRNVQLKRNGKLVGRLDLYDLLLNGDTRADRRLQPGDVIFVPPVGDRVGIEGEAIRPAYYELRGPATAGDLVRLAGGLTPMAHRNTGRIERVTNRGDRQIIDADLSSSAGLGVALVDGDVLRVYPVLDRLDDSIELSGHVWRPVQYQWRDDVRLTDVLPAITSLKPAADLGYIMIRRERDNGRLEVVSADLRAALENPSSDENPQLMPRDRVMTFPYGPTRGVALQAVVDELKAQAGNGDDPLIVSIGGQVIAPGEYPLEAQMRVSDLLRAGGGISNAAFLRDAELTRYVIGEDGSRQTQLVNLDLERVLQGDLLADEVLQPFDNLIIREIPEWRGQETVSIEGEVRFPGTYSIKRGETLASVVERAGGLTDLSFVAGSLFTRESLKRREEEQIDGLISRLEADLAALALQGNQLSADSQQAFAFGQSLLAQLRESEAAGRLVIELDQILADGIGSTSDIVLKDGDRLLIPQQTQEVTVIGEVQYATSHLFDSELDRSDYIARSGGLTAKADDKRIYVVRANGQVVAGTSTVWLRRTRGTDIRPGDTIVVPIDADRIAPLTLWSSVTQIVYNLAVAVAAVNSF
ncbi:MAG: SLBB domain-containing protein [Pseudomonadota bacterium]